MASKYTEAEISALKGTELIYTFNTYGDDDVTTLAYVAQADINKGITIMGTVPKKYAKRLGISEDDEIIVQCCNFNVGTKEEVERVMDEYVHYIRDGLFNARLIQCATARYDKMIDNCVF